MRFTVPFRLIEISVISAKGLAPVSRSMKTYAIAWVHPNRKMTTRVDQVGGCNPNWNEKFVFRVDSDFLEHDASAIMIEIYNVAWLKKDTRVGNVRVLISDILSSSVQTTQFVAFQVRRPSGRPQGILTLGVTLVDNTLRSMPLFPEPAPDPPSKPDPEPKIGSWLELRRTSSDVTALTTDPHGSVVGAPKFRGGSVVGGSENKRRVNGLRHWPVGLNRGSGDIERGLSDPPSSGEHPERNSQQFDRKRRRSRGIEGENRAVANGIHSDPRSPKRTRNPKKYSTRASPAANRLRRQRHVLVLWESVRDRVLDHVRSESANTYSESSV